MNMTATVDEMDGFSFHETILQQGELISDKLNMLRIEHFPPDAMKSLRTFSLAEVAYFLGVTQSNIKKLHLDGKGPIPTTLVSGRRTYTAEQMLELRQYLDRHGRADFKKYVPHRRAGEQLQVIAVVNFKGGSGKTTTAAHLAQHLALTGHRVLAIDLDPQASLSALHGIQPELDKNPSLYEALRYDEARKPISKVIRSTNFPGLDIVPANLNFKNMRMTLPSQHQVKSSADGRMFFTRITRS